MKIFIEPNDVLMFRDGKPFSGGDDHYARGTFPPSPSTFYGALRSKILSEKYPQYESFKDGNVPEGVKKEIGTPSEQGSLTLQHFSLAKRVDGAIHPIFPVPKDVVKIKGMDEKIVFILKPEESLNNKISCNFPFASLVPLWLKTEIPIEEVNGFLSLQAMSAYLCGNVPDEIMKSDRLYKKDERVGIKKDRTRKAAATGALYSVEYFRFAKEIGFAVELGGVEKFPQEGLLRLGGDHRSAFYQESSFSLPDKGKVKNKIKDTGQFKIVFLTPAIFDKGWLPDWIDTESGIGTVNNITLKLISAALDKPVHIGGFDIVKKTPKDMKKAVSAGSVFFFSIEKRQY
ncbi:MAG: type III-B CRISPR module-associated protein Cmr3 [Candidatus Brocadia carolinensis]|uniref:Type III-B CRISPR module-associated protein Cmr3 n=1 Tax=Candidatus Brocadia carolinensis TaxID=1004156 RepID=A0A1V4AR82_9BACT|nr:MAG: type III-B CRISPR module-associated protein Cmr3 [Candidatus Brocadia caroliniensis]